MHHSGKSCRENAKTCPVRCLKTESGNLQSCGRAVRLRSRFAQLHRTRFALRSALAAPREARRAKRGAARGTRGGCLRGVKRDLHEDEWNSMRCFAFYGTGNPCAPVSPSAFFRSVFTELTEDATMPR